MEIVYGGAKEGAFLTSHPTIKSIHLTGSSATYDAVVWGKQKKARHICSESFCTWSTNQKGGSLIQKNHYSECWTHSHASHLQCYIHTHMSISELVHTG